MRAHQIAFGDDAGDRALAVEHQHRADTPDTELLGELGHRGARRHRENETALLRRMSETNMVPPSASVVER